MEYVAELQSEVSAMDVQVSVQYVVRVVMWCLMFNFFSVFFLKGFCVVAEDV